jgi:hypothetical protein
MLALNSLPFPLLNQDFCKLAGIPAQKLRVQQLEQMLSDPSSSLDEVLDFVLN